MHAAADITDTCVGAGGHWNPKDKTHGSINPSDKLIAKTPATGGAHVGAMGNISADNTGRAIVDKHYGGTLEGWDPLQQSISMLPDSEYTPVGRAIVIHAGQDDLGMGTGDAEEGSLATGNAGARVGCCVIEAVDNAALPEGARCDSS